MRTKLITFNDGREPIVVSDEKIGYSERYIDEVFNIGTAAKNNAGFYKNCKKIIAQGFSQIDFKEGLESKFGVVDVKKLADDWWKNNPKNKDYALWEQRNGFIEGFKVAQELNTKKFSEEDMREAIAESWNSCEDNENEETFTQCFNRIIQSLLKPYQVFDVEVEMEYYYMSSEEFYGKSADWVACEKEQYNSIKLGLSRCPLKIEPKFTCGRIRILNKL